MSACRRGKFISGLCTENMAANCLVVSGADLTFCLQAVRAGACRCARGLERGCTSRCLKCCRLNEEVL